MEDIQKRQRHIEDRVFLIDILEREGHITLEEQAALRFERKLALTQGLVDLKRADEILLVCRSAA